MDVLFLLIPLSVLLSFGVLGVLAWAIWSGQFEDVDGEGLRILDEPQASAGLERTSRRQHDRPEDHPA